MQPPIHFLLLGETPSDSEFQDSLLSFFRQSQWQVIQVSSLGEALDYLYDQSFDAVVIDLTTPESPDGEEIARLCRTFPGVAVIVLTGPEGEGGLEAIQDGAQDYLIKEAVTAREVARSLRCSLQRLRHQTFSPFTEEASADILPSLPQSQETPLPLLPEQDEDPFWPLRTPGPAQSCRDMVVRSLPDTTITFINEPACQALGCQAEAVLGEPWIGFLAHQDPFGVLEQIAQLSPENPSFAIEHQIATADRRDRWYEWINTGIFQGPQLVELVGVGRDITERKQAENVLRHSERVYQALIQPLPDLIMRMTGNGQYLDFFPTDTFPLLGGPYPVGDSIYESHLPHDLIQQRMQYAQRALETGELQIFEQNLSMDGAIRTEEVRITVCGDNEVLVIVRDITDLKQTELVLQQLNQELEARVKQRTGALQESEERFRQIFEQSPLGIAISDLDGRITRLNVSLSSMLECPASDLMGQSIYELLQSNREGDIPQLEQILEHTLTVVSFERQPVTRTGKELWVNVISALIFNAFGRPSSILHLIKDISDRKQTELENELLQERLEFVLAASPAVIYTCQIGEDYAATFVSPNVQNLLGYEPAAFLEASDFWLNHIHPDDRPQVVENLPSFLAGEHHTFEYRFLHRDGQYRWLQDEPKLIYDAAGKAIEVVGYLADISDRKQTEEKLRQVNERLTLTNAELYRATRLKDEFLAVMSHELRTPLNAILGMSEGLLEGVIGELNDRQKHSISIIERSGKHLLDLINDILDLSKIEAGKLELQQAPVAVQHLCEGSLAFVKQQAFKKQIQLTIEMAQGLPDIVVDERRIRQAIINLLSNAVKFTPDGGSVTLEVRPLKQDDRFWLRFAVIDTGIGIAPDDVKRLFTPFAQVDSSLNRQYEGTGLGLALVRRLVELHQGKVGATSTLGEGSCFTICLPYTVAPASQGLMEPDAGQRSLQSSVAERSANGGLPFNASVSSSAATVLPKPAIPTILLAEDNPANIDTLSCYLESRNFRVLVAKNGREAIALAQEQIPDLILMDIQMPEVDGLEAIRTLRANADLPAIPIIALTALAMPGDRERCLEAGANDYLTKPIRLKVLVETIQQFLAVSEATPGV